MVAGLFPETELILSPEFQTAQPFSPFPQISRFAFAAVVKRANQPAQRIAMIGCQRFTFVMRRQQEVVLQNQFDGRVRRVAVFLLLNTIKDKASR